MSKLTEIIRREVKDLVSKQGGLMVTPAVVTAVQEDYLRADVKLLGNGAEIKKMLNKSPGKLTVGQTVTVAYETLPSSGVILIANGETDPLSEGGGWEVDTAAVLDANNVHQWLAQEELMADVNPATKLLYGGHPLTAIIQGYACAWRRGSMTTLPLDIAEYFGTKVEFDVMWRETKDDPYVPRHIVAEIVVNSKNYNTSSGVTYEVYTFGLTVSRYAPGSVAAENVITRTRSVSKAIDAFIVPIMSAVSGNTTYTNTWSRVTESTSTPHGYVEGNMLYLTFGYITSDAPDVITLLNWRSGSSDSNPYIGGEHRCIPLSSEAEKYFDLGISKRSEPRGD